MQQLLSQDVRHPFGKSTGYDVVVDGRRFPPKLVFGLAIKEALGVDPKPDDFYGGEDTPCFAAIRNAGFLIEPKATPTIQIPPDPQDRAWLEGDRRRVTHLIIERNPEVAKRKKELVRQEHGRLICEHCGFVPTATYGSDHGDAVIEVHHTVPLSSLARVRTTSVADLVCVCANCHRVLHARLRRKAATPSSLTAD